MRGLEFITVNFDRGLHPISYPVNTADEIRVAKEAIQEAGLASAEVWVSPPDSPDVRATGTVLFAR